MTDDTDQDSGEQAAEATQDAAENTGRGEAGREAAGGDEAAGGEAGGGEAGGGEAAGGEGGGAEDERLAKLGEQIDQARTKARETIGEPEEKFYESGDAEAEQEDDQTIAPPG